MSMFSWLLAAGVVAVASAWFVERRGRLTLRAELVGLRSELERNDGLRTRLRHERRRVRRSHRLKRRAQRVVAMARAISGCRDGRDATQRAVRAIVDGFGARTVSIWSVGEGARCLASAGESESQGEEVVMTLSGDEQEAVAELHVAFESKRRMPTGLDAYAAVLGTVLGVCDWPFEQTSGAVERREPSVARAA